MGVADRPFQLRDYSSTDEAQWLRCRALAFLDTSYFDDVVTRKPAWDGDLQIVAVVDGTTVGLLDASVDGAEATIETVAVHPDYRRHGIGRALMQGIYPRLQRRRADHVHAWTRENEAASNWYRALGFEETMRYLHVYASSADEAAGASGTRTDLMPRGGFIHAWPEHEVTTELPGRIGLASELWWISTPPVTLWPRRANSSPKRAERRTSGIARSAALSGLRPRRRRFARWHALRPAGRWGRPLECLDRLRNVSMMVVARE